MTLETMSKEFQEKAKACKSIEELRDLCADQGVELTEEEISGLAGGVQVCMGDTSTCWLDTGSGPSCSFVLQ